jgi:hypothetical protein
VALFTWILYMPELNPSAQLPIFLLGILICKGLTARRLYKSFGVKGLTYPLMLRSLSEVLNVCQKNGEAFLWSLL